MPRRVVLSKSGRVSSQVVTDFHCRAGYMHTGQRSKVWCSCGWRTEFEGVSFTKVDEAIRAHKQELA